MHEPLTVGIVAFNEENRIQGCLESLEFLKNHVSDLHVILVDNNSEDKTAEVSLKILNNKNLSHTLIKREKNNLAEARNDILNSAKTRWIYMLDADCRLDQSTWPNLMSHWSLNPLIAAWAGSQKFNTDREILFLLDQMRNTYLGHFGSAQMIASGEVEFLEHVSTTHVLFDKNALLEVKGFNPLLASSAEDLDLSLRLRKKGYHLQFNPKSFLWHDQVQSWQQWAYKAFRNGIWQTRLIAYNLEILKTRRPWPGILLWFSFLLPLWFWILSAASYFAVVVFLVLMSKTPLRKKAQLFALFVMTHFLYASGEMTGVILAANDSIRKKRLPVSTNV